MNKLIVKTPFVMPEIDETVDILVSDTKGLTPGCWLWNESVGYLKVNNYTNFNNTITVENIGREENVKAKTNFPTCMEFLITAPTAIDLFNNMSTCLKADFNSPAEGQEAYMSVESTYVMKAGDQIIVDRTYRYLIVQIVNSTTLKVKNEGLGKIGIIEVDCNTCVPVQVVNELNCCPIPSGDLTSNTPVVSIVDGEDVLLASASITLDTDLSKYDNSISKFIDINGIPRGTLNSTTSILSVINGTNNVLSNISLSLDTDLSKYNNTSSAFITLGDIPRGTLSAISSLLTITDGTNNVLDNISIDLDTDLSKYDNSISNFLATTDKKDLISNTLLIIVTNGTGATLENTSLSLDTDLSKYDNSISEFLATTDKKDLTSTTPILTVTNGVGTTLENTSLSLDTDLSKYDNSNSQFVSLSGIPSGDLTSTTSVLSVAGGTGATLTNTTLTLDTDLSKYDNSTSDFISASSLAAVATSGDYNDLLNKPTIPTVNDATLTIQKNSTDVGTFTANSSSNATINITVPTDTSDLTNGADYITSGDIPSGDLSSNSSVLTVTDGTGATLSNTSLTLDTDLSKYDNTTSDFVDSTALSTKQDVIDANNKLDYSLIANTPSIPTVNDATLTIQKNSSNVGTFTANSSTNVTVDITVPTDTSDLTNGAGFITSASLPTVNDAILTIQQNGTNLDTFTANASVDKTVNIVETIQSASSPLSISSNALSISQATTSTDGYLSSTDWNTFNGKQNEINANNKLSTAFLSFDSNLIPTAGGTYDLGSGSIFLKGVYSNGFYLSTYARIIPQSTYGLNIHWYNDEPGGGNRDLLFVRNQLYMYQDNVVSLGIASGRWRTIYYNGGSLGSDRRYKDNIEDLENALEVVNDLEVKSYTMINNSENISYGIIAQDTVEKYPELISIPHNDDEYYGVHTQNIMFLTLKAVQELSSKVDELNAKIKELEDSK